MPFDIGTAQMKNITLKQIGNVTLGQIADLIGGLIFVATVAYVAYLVFITGAREWALAEPLILGLIFTQVFLSVND